MYYTDKILKLAGRFEKRMKFSQKSLENYNMNFFKDENENENAQWEHWFSGPSDKLGKNDVIQSLANSYEEDHFEAAELLNDSINKLIKLKKAVMHLSEDVPPAVHQSINNNLESQIEQIKDLKTKLNELTNYTLLLHLHPEE